MTRYDVFNGDADGLCALRQLRRAEPAESVLVTGTKRDITLLGRVRATAGDEVAVLDISIARNLDALMAVLAAGARVRYFDHHACATLPRHENLEVHHDPSRDTCTALIVDRVVGGRFGDWAVAGAFGDNASEAALRRAAPLGLEAEALAGLRELGELLNYAAYGADASEQLISAAPLYRILERHARALDALREPIMAELGRERRADLTIACSIHPLRSLPRATAWLLPDAPWSRRVSGEFANRMASAAPTHAQAVITRGGGGLRVSLRTPPGAPVDAARFCARYAAGGGREAAAGIDGLPEADLDRFIDDFARTYA